MKRVNIEKAAQDYDDNLIYSSLSEQYDIQKAFKAGAKWRIKSVWHDADKELPEYDKHVVNEDWFDFIAKDEKGLKRIMKKYPFSKWAYVEDLKPDANE